jgi:glycosyltransferase involved in cell wall biosynthesis
LSQTKVLIVAYWFPPAGGIAVQRALSLAKYLPALGFEVHVLAPKNPPAPVLDPDLLRRIPPQVRIHRAITPMPSAHWRSRIWSLVSPKKNGAAVFAPAPPRKGWKSSLKELIRGILSPDPEIVWFPFALWKASRIIRKEGIQVMIVTAPPFSLFVLGNALKRRFPGVRYISDFRDDWLRFFLGTFDFHSSDAIRKQATRIEHETVNLSDVVLHVTAMLSKETRDRYPAQPSSKFQLVPNGYDPEIFAGFQSRPHSSPNVVITYVGTVYKTTSPGMYFDALEALPEELRAGIETRFVGRITNEEKALIEKRSSLVKFIGFVPQSEAVRYMEETDFLLVTMIDPTAATGKLYEYLATGKPILAIAPKGGEVDALFEETGVGWCIDPGDHAGLQQMLRDAYAMARQGTVKLQRNEEAIRRYERPRLAAEVGRIIEACL